MTYNLPLQKDRAAYCSQCYDSIRLRCPICLLTKIPRHCKIYKNTAALWWHIRQDHDNFACSQFDTDEVRQVLNAITTAMQWGILVN